MKFLPLLFANFKRKKLRTLFTLLSIFVAFVLYGVLMALKTGFGAGIELAGEDRLVMLNKVSIIQPIPISYLGRIEADEGVEDAAYANWFGGIYQDPKNFFPSYAVDPERWLRLYPEIDLPEDQKQAWLADRTGAIVGRTTAERFGWKIGDRIPLTSPIYRRDDGSKSWEFTIDGIYGGKTKTADTTALLFHYKFLEEASSRIAGLVGWYVIKVNDPPNAAAIAKRIDERFANSSFETKTATEKAFIQGWANQTGNIAAIVTGIVAVVFFTLLLVAGNTMAQSVRERTSELAVLKTLGFSDRKVMALVLAESLLLAVLGGGLGLGLVTALTHAFKLGGAIFPILFVPLSSAAIGALFVLALGFVAGFLPALRALRLNIVEALRRA